MFGIVDNGTHNFDLYISPGDLDNIMTEVGFEMRSLDYCFYNPVNKEFYYTDVWKTNYLVYYVKV